MKKILYPVLLILLGLNLSVNASNSIRSIDENSDYFKGKSYRNLVEFGMGHSELTAEQKTIIIDLMDTYGQPGSGKLGLGRHESYYIGRGLINVAIAAGAENVDLLKRSDHNHWNIYPAQTLFGTNAGFVIGVVYTNAYESKEIEAGNI